jgi:hypothetical protein
MIDMKKSITWSLVTLIAIALIFDGNSAFTANSTHLQITKEGKANAFIRLNKDASPSERLAAKELQDYVEKISGAKLQVSESKIQGVKIAIGVLKNLTTLPPEVKERLTEAKNDESFYIKTMDEKIYIVGKEPIGALYGTYTLLEKLGVRWLYPSEQGECVPKTKTINLKSIDNFETPSLSYRSISFCCASYNFAPSLIWMARNKMNIKWSPAVRIFDGCTQEQAEFFNNARNAKKLKGGHHLLRMAVPKKKYFETNPEYFALLDGKRRCIDRDQRCISNITVQKLCEDLILKHTLKGKKYHGFFGAEDAIGRWCQCEKCRNMGTVDGKFSVTNLVHRFFSTVERNVLRRNPGAQFEMHIYNKYRNFPTAKDIKYKSTLGLYCSHQRCYVHEFKDPECKCNKKQYAEFKEWLKVCPRMSIRDYIQFANCEYSPFEYIVGKDIKELTRIGAYGWTDECTPAYGRMLPEIAKYHTKAADMWPSNWPTYYVAAKLAWDSKLDVDKLMENAYTEYYGKAAPAMLKYQNLRRKLWENAPGHAFYGGPARTGYCLTVPGAEEKLNGFLNAGEKAASDNTLVLKRIAMDKHYLNKYWKKESDKRKKLFSAEKKILPQESNKKLTIDGNLSEDVWGKARPVTGFISLTTKEAPQEDTSIRVAYDKENLYFGVVAINKKSWGPAIAKAKKHDGNVWEDDSVELQMAPPGNEGVFYHIMSNTNGVVYDAQVSGSDMGIAYTSNCEVKVKKLADRYIYEFKIPQKSLNCKVEPGQVWQMHFIRNCRSLQPPVTKETSTTDGVAPHAVMSFRRAVFGNSVIKNGNFSEIIGKKKVDLGVIGDKFIKNWGVNARGGCEVVESNQHANKLLLKNGVIYQLLRIQPEEKKRVLMGNVNASGKGQLTIKTRTFFRKPTGAFGSLPPTKARIKEIGIFDLTEKSSIFNFKAKFAPYEIGYIYIYVKGEALINNINGVIIKDKELKNPKP